MLQVPSLSRQTRLARGTLRLLLWIGALLLAWRMLPSDMQASAYDRFLQQLQAASAAEPEKTK